jgi:hypothetical protein
MKTKNNTFNQRITLDMNANKRHQKDLGLDIPENYFASSKKSILEKTINQKRGKVISLSKKIYAWSAAAVVLLLFTLAIYNPTSSGDNIEEDVLIASLFTEESNIDVFLEEFVNNELLTEDVFKNN